MKKTRPMHTADQRTRSAERATTIVPCNDTAIEQAACQIAARRHKLARDFPAVQRSMRIDRRCHDGWRVYSPGFELACDSEFIERPVPGEAAKHSPRDARQDPSVAQPADDPASTRGCGDCVSHIASPQNCRFGCLSGCPIETSRLANQSCRKLRNLFAHPQAPPGFEAEYILRRQRHTAQENSASRPQSSIAGRASVVRIKRVSALVIRLAVNARGEPCSALQAGDNDEHEGFQGVTSYSAG